MNQETENTILKKIGIKQKRSAIFILSDEKLCKRILEEDVIWTEDFIEKYQVPKYIVDRLIKSNTLSYFSNHKFTRGCKKFLFEQEALYFFKEGIYKEGVYHEGFTQAYNLSVYLVLSYSKLHLNLNEYKILKMRLLNKYSIKHISTELNIKEGEVNNIVYNSYRKAKKYSEALPNIKALQEQIEALMTMEKILKKSIKEYKDILPTEANDLLDESSLVKVKIEDLQMSVRLKNILNDADIHTLYELTIIKRSHLLKYRNFGAKTLRELDELMEDYGLCFKTEFDEPIRIN